MSRVTSAWKSSRIFMVGSRVDSGSVVAVGGELPHEREGRRVLALAWIEEDHWDVPRLPVDVLQERRRTEERIERASAADQHEAAIGRRVRMVGKLVDQARHVGGDAFGPFDVRSDLVAQVCEGARGIFVEEAALPLDQSADVGLPRPADAIEDELLER